MATTYTDNGGGVANGSKLEFTYTFPVLQTEDVKVALNGVTQATTKYAVDTASNPTKITFNANNIDSSVQEPTTVDGKVAGAPKTGVRVRVYRETTVGKTSGDDDPKAVFASGSSIRAVDLNANTEQALYAIHELQSRPIENEDIQDYSITTNKLENNIISNANVADNAINSRNYVDGSIDTEHIADNQVTAAKLADSINTEIAANTAKNTNVTTNLSTNTTNTTVTIVSSDGTNAVIPEASGTSAGVMSVTDHNKLAGIENNAKDHQTAEEIKARLNGSGLVNAQIASDANISGSKINPSFSGNIIGTGNLQVGQGQFSTATNNQIILRDDESGNSLTAARVAMAFRNESGTQLGKIGPFYDDSDIHIQNDVGDGHIVLRTKTGDVVTKRFTVNTSGAEVHGDLTVTNGTIAGTLNSSVTATTQVSTDSSTKIATTAFAKGVFSDQQTAIDAKLPLAGGTLTGNLKLQSNFPRLLLVDGNNTNNALPDYLFQLNEGVLKISEKDNVNDAPNVDRIYIRREQTGTDGNGDPTYGRSVELVDEVVLKRANPKIQFKDTSGTPNDDYRIKVNSGNFEIEDFKNNSNDPRLRIFDNGDVKIWHNLTLLDGKTVDGRDISADGTKLDGIEANAINASNTAITNKLPLAGGTLTGNVTFDGGKNTTYNPNATGGGLVINHTGTIAQFRNLTGNTRISCADGNLIRLQNTDASKLFAAFGGATDANTNNDSHVDLYFNNGRKATTVTDGLQVIGKLRAGFETNLPTLSSTTRAVLSGAIGSNDNSSSGISIFCKGNGNSRINFGNTETEERSQIKYNTTHNRLDFFVRDLTNSTVANQTLNTQLRLNASSVELNYAGAKKAETSATGFDVSGFINTTHSTNGYSLFKTEDMGSGLKIASKTASAASKLVFSSNHSGTLTNNWFVGGQSNGSAYTLTVGKGDIDGMNATPMLQISDGVQLNYANTVNGSYSIKAQTSSTGFDITGNLTTTGNIDLTDSSNILLGTDDDLDISHNGSVAKIINNTGNFNIQGDKIRLFDKAGTSYFIDCGTTTDGVILFFNGAEKAQTSSTGFNVIGGSTGTTFKLRNTANNADLVKIFHSGLTNGNAVISCQIGDIKIQPNEDGGQVRLFENSSGSVNQRLVTTSNGITVTGTVNESSDVALKENIQPLSNVLEKVKQLTGYKYNFKNTTNNSMGVIAQDVEKVFPELVHGEEGKKSLQYSGLIGALVESIKELSDKISVLESKK